MENTREKLAAIATWLGWQNEDLSCGLRSVSDAEKLYDYWAAHGEILPEFCDYNSDDLEILEINIRQHRIAAVGYDPLNSKN